MIPEGLRISEATDLTGVKSPGHRGLCVAATLENKVSSLNMSVYHYIKPSAKINHCTVT